ncbi:MAG: response regulator transcription factor [Aureispira sp.]|nr:response regulator transcription factor [Aureispira sp.]
MTSIKTIIVEDEPHAKAMLLALLEKFCPQVEVLGSATNVQDAITLIHQTEPDLVFLDIEMPGEKGIQLFDYFEEVDFEVIFTTAYDQYAINALRLSALDYLLKPIDLKELRRAIAKFDKQTQKKSLYESLQHHFDASSPQKHKRIVLPTKESFQFLELKDIMYIQIESSYTIFIDIKQKKHIVSKPFKEYAEALESFGFIRVHRSSIINPNYVSKIIRTRPSSVVMKDGTKLAVSKSRREFLINELTKI